MDAQFWYEMVGYAGSLLVAISLMMKSLLKLRIINLIGALFFTVYGLLIHAYPVAFMNGLIVCIDLYYLIQMLRQKDYFTLLEVSHDSAYLQQFIEFHKLEISVFFPNFEYLPKEEQLTFFILRNMVPAGLFIVEPQNEMGSILLDFVIPGYRDFQVGRFVFDENAAFFTQHGIRRFISAPGNTAHTSYLMRMGFSHAVDGQFVRKLGGNYMRDDGI